MKIKWLFYSITGLLLFGMGLSIAGEAIILKYDQSNDWFLWGTLALIITNTGLCLFGQAVIEKVKINLQTDDS
jgi:divalent metal cation (Fe/Co/Zn/Cd) transporter